MYKRHLRSTASAILFISALMLPSTSTSAQAPHSKVEISFSAKVASSLPMKGDLILRPLDGDGDHPIRLAITSPSALSMTLPAGSKWEISAELPGFWVPRKSLAVGPQAQPSRLILDLWPMGAISGIVKIKSTKGVPLPKHILVKTLAAPTFLKRPAVPKGAMDCPVDEKGAWSCSLPAATFDLAISIEGSAPQYRWGVQVPAGKTLPLGTIELERGASVAGWVAVEEGTIEPNRCAARLAFLVAGGANLQSVSDLERMAFQGEVRKDGFFQLTGLTPGTYTLEIQQPGYPATRLSPIRVDSNTETFLREPLVLRHSFDLQFEVHPALDWLGQPWHAQIFRLGERQPSPRVFDGLADKEGRLIVSGQSSGHVRVILKDSLGNSFYSGEHSVDSAASAPQSIDVRFVTVEGNIRLGTEPLAAVLWFGGRSGVHSAKMEADTEGWFHGVLPQEGLWTIEVEASQPGFPTWTRAEVRTGQSDKAKLDITLPNTRIFGYVIDEQGKRVPKADVVVLGEGVDLNETADAMGDFEVRGLPEGSVWLGAESSSQISDRAFAVLVDSREVGPVELRLRATKRLTGTVVSPQGPVAGSRVMIQARTPDGGAAVTTTDTDGVFHVDLPQSVTRIVAVVSAPGSALRAFDATTAEGESLSLQVTPEEGRLEVTLPMSGEDLMRENLVLAAFQNGLPVPNSTLNQWAYDHGQYHGANDQTLRIPSVAPGEYLVCLLPQQFEILLPWSPIRGATCDSGFLAAGATLLLKPSRPSSKGTKQVRFN